MCKSRFVMGGDSSLRGAVGAVRWLDRRAGCGGWKLCRAGPLWVV